MKALLINPWIADFAAYNFWIRPLGLYRLASWLHCLGVEVEMIDCLSPFKAPGKFKRHPEPFPINQDKDLSKIIGRSFARYGISRHEFKRRVNLTGGFDVVFITSVMSYWYPGIAWVLEEIRAIDPSIPVVLGGIYATLWPEHAKTNLDIDLLCQGPIELNEQKLKSFLGIEKQTRPYRPWYEILGWDGANYGAVRTAIGCPFSCTYCASRIVNGHFSPLSPEEVTKEIIFLHSTGIRQIAFYDDALLVDFEGRLLKILEKLQSKGIFMEFHTPNGLHARLIDRQIAKWLVRSNFKTIRLSLETVSHKRQRLTGGKVSNEDFERAVNLLLSEGMKTENMGAYLMIGLPGQDLDEIEQGIKYVKSLGIRPYLAEFSPIPKTVEWDRLKDEGIVSDEMDPLLTNNTLFFRLHSGYDQQRFEYLKRLART